MGLAPLPGARRQRHQDRARGFPPVSAIHAVSGTRSLWVRPDRVAAIAPHAACAPSVGTSEQNNAPAVTTSRRRAQSAIVWVVQMLRNRVGNTRVQVFLV